MNITGSMPRRTASLYDFGQGMTYLLSWTGGMRCLIPDFHVILDIRNEAAVAFLALKQWDEYGYNNAAYTTLYKLLGEDQSLEDFCHELERSTNNKTVSILLVIILLAFTLCLGSIMFCISAGDW